MRPNYSKTKTMLFSRSKTRDFPPRFFDEKGETIEVIESLCLLGIVLHSDLKWVDNTKSMIKSAYSRFGLLTKLKKLGAS